MTPFQRKSRDCVTSVPSIPVRSNSFCATTCVTSPSFCSMPCDFEQPRAAGDAPRPRPHALPDDEVHVAGFILERDEHDATRALRALARRDDARHTDHAPMRQVAQIG